MTNDSIRSVCRRSGLWALALLLLLLPTPASADLEILVPAYFYPVPGSPWNQLIADAPRVPITAILNPGSGPGTFQDMTYVSTVSAFRAAGGKILAYVPTTYGARSAAAVKADVDTYRAWYAIDGVFLDETPSDNAPAHLAYYTDIYQFIKGRDAAYRVVMNPGTNAAEEYLSRPCADALVLFENGTGYDTYQAEAYVYRYGRARVAHLLYDVAGAAAMNARVDQALSRNVGLLFITDDVLTPNPWDTLPAYWAAEVERLIALNVSAVAEAPAPVELRVVPTPDGGALELSLNHALPGGLDAALFDVRGRRIAAWNRPGAVAADRAVRLPLRAPERAALPRGIYFLRVTGDDLHATRRLRLGG